jgi:transcriptional regulator with XRE-family HTH domain
MAARKRTKRTRRKQVATRAADRSAAASAQTDAPLPAYAFPTDAQIEDLAAAVRAALGHVAPLIEARGPVLRDVLRFQPLAKRLRAEREARGLSLKQAAGALHCAQYKLRAIEESQVERIEAERLHAYSDHLGLGAFVDAWCAANAALATRLGLLESLAPARGRRAAASHANSTYRLRITLLDVAPDVWRLIDVPATYTFWDLHVAIQDAMGWLDCHLHMFRRAEDDADDHAWIGIPDVDGIEEERQVSGRETPIALWLGEVGDVVAYTYDFGDDWEHAVVLEAILPREPRVRLPREPRVRLPREPRVRLPRCLDGARACPPEDCGGARGYAELLRILRDPRHREHAEMREWLGRPFDPAEFRASDVVFEDPEARWRSTFHG